MEKRRRMTREEREHQLHVRMGIAAAAFVVLLLIIAAVVRFSGSGKKDGSRNPEAVPAADTMSAAVETEVQTEVQTETETPPDPYADKPEIDINSWEFILANSTHSISDYAPQTAPIESVELDARIISAMTSFVADTRAQGLSVVLTSGYRSYDTQTYLFNNKVAQYGGDEATAATIVARPGTSEHQTGLAADITDQYYQFMNESLESTATYQWMSQHCHEYGFIVRFPKGKEDITGIMYEPWHYRYVGVPAATYIMEHGLTLEEFVELYQ